MPPEHAISGRSGVLGLISLSCGVHLSCAVWTFFRGRQVFIFVVPTLEPANSRFRCLNTTRVEQFSRPDSAMSGSCPRRNQPRHFPVADRS
jgi:hypothetical protein